ncbi:response regulator [Gluconacetobacter tumulicola]|nr:response regulator transcription factor [Gluconacetobacter tumulicola]
MTNMTHLLIVDDDEEILSLLTRFFETYGHEVSVASGGREMFAVLETASINLVILDLMMPGENGLELCAELRQKSQVPIIMLTAVDTPTDRVVGLELGADDYITKPFDQRELLARVKAVLRRIEPMRQLTTQTRPLLLFGSWRLDIARRELRTAKNILIPLSGREFDLLLAFAERPHEVMSRDQLLDLAHGERHDAFDRSIDTQVSRLRRKLEPNAKDPAIIKTVRSGGYIFTLDVRPG